MKQTFLLVFVLVSVHVFGQFEKGDKVLSGSASFNRSDDNSGDGAGTQLSITPRFGYFFTTSLEAGLELGWSTSRVKTETSKFTSNTLAPGLYVGRYFELTDKFFFRVIASGVYSRTKEKQRVSGPFGVFEDEQNANQLGIFVSPGFVFFPNRHWGFGATIGNVYFTRLKIKESGNRQSDLGFTAGSLSFSVAYYFRKEADSSVIPNE